MTIRARKELVLYILCVLVAIGLVMLNQWHRSPITGSLAIILLVILAMWGGTRVPAILDYILGPKE